MSRSSADDNFIDPSKQARSTLDYIISGTEEKVAKEVESQMPVSQALSSEHVVEFASSRSKARILFLTSDPEALKDTSALQKHIQNIHDVFQEIHVAVLMPGKKREFPTQRLGESIWVYSVNFSTPLFLAETMVSFAESQLQFGEGFRPDVIVALDPYYSGQAALSLSKQYGRPVQIHVSEDFMTESFTEHATENKQKVRLARQVLKKAKSVRTSSAALKQKLEKKFPKIEDVGVLPRHFDTDAMLKNKRSTKIKQQYPQYIFMMITAAPLDHDSTVFRTLDAARTLLHSPRIGLMVVGDGPMKGELEKRAQILGIREQVVFEADYSKLQDYLLSADMFVCTDTTAVGDEYVIRAAAAGLPIVMARTPLREDLFVDGESGLFNAAEDITGFTKQMNSILNNNAFRTQFGINARSVVKERLHTDPELYKAAYRDTIEVVFGNEQLPSTMKTSEENISEVADGEGGEETGEASLQEEMGEYIQDVPEINNLSEKPATA